MNYVGTSVVCCSAEFTLEGDHKPKWFCGSDIMCFHYMCDLGLGQEAEIFNVDILV